MKVKNSTAWWTLVAIIACCMWGISGIFAKELFNIDTSISAIWLTQVRMIIAGAILLLVGKIRGERTWKSGTIKATLAAWFSTAFWA